MSELQESESVFGDFLSSLPEANVEKAPDTKPFLLRGPCACFVLERTRVVLIDGRPSDNNSVVVLQRIRRDRLCIIRFK